MKINENKIEIAHIMEEEKEHLFRYVCYRIGNINEVEDILQDLFIKLCSTKGDIENMRSYLYRSLLNNCNSRLKEKQRFQLDFVDNLENIEIEELAPTNFEEEFVVINKLLLTLPDEQSEIIRLKIHAAKTFREISEILHIPLTTAKSRYKYGIDKLREGLKKECLI
ncbi:MAG: RNA polymerase sigma factor [Bacteroidales bacterium]|nr:RNA polymerase sigma factor [Bacteroidales bacterium]